MSVPVSEEAVHLHRVLAGLNRDAYLPEYTNARTVPGHVLVEEARFREAIAPLVQAFIAGRQLPVYAQSIVGAIVDLLRRTYAGDADGVSEKFRTVTGQDVPE